MGSHPRVPIDRHSVGFKTMFLHSFETGANCYFPRETKSLRKRASKFLKHGYMNLYPPPTHTHPNPRSSYGPALNLAHTSYYMLSSFSNDRSSKKYALAIFQFIFQIDSIYSLEQLIMSLWIHHFIPE